MDVYLRFGVEIRNLWDGLVRPVVVDGKRYVWKLSWSLVYDGESKIQKGDSTRKFIPTLTLTMSKQ
jgi:hypothetical protein